MTDFVTLAGAEYTLAGCPSCKISYLIPRGLHDVAYARRPAITVYCPNGHAWTYSLGESEFDRIRRERDRLRQKLAERDDEIRAARGNALHWQTKAQAAAKDATRLKKRAGGGVCPCCSRHFAQMERHMKTKHPTFIAQAT